MSRLAYSRLVGSNVCVLRLLIVMLLPVTVLFLVRNSLLACNMPTMMAWIFCMNLQYSSCRLCIQLATSSTGSVSCSVPLSAGLSATLFP